MNSLEKMVVAKQIKHIVRDDMINDFKMLKEYIIWANGLAPQFMHELLQCFKSTGRHGNRKIHILDFFNDIEEYIRNAINNFLYITNTTSRGKTIRLITLQSARSARSTNVTNVRDNQRVQLDTYRRSFRGSGSAYWGSPAGVSYTGSTLT
jgi:CRISPR/Cas system CSM-associated protein Csm5 (group 7 of RAMP superfamily)